MSVSPAECPATELLESVALGHDASPTLRDHLATCETCRLAVERIRDDNRFLSGFAIRGALPVSRRATTLHDITVPGYEIVREIHRGGQGVVYQAVQRAPRRDVAIKVMRQGPFATLSDRARFEREIETLGKLEHPSIVTVHDAGVVAGFHYFVMNYVDGLPLDEWVAQYSPPSADARQRTAGILNVFISVCEAVHAAHLRGVIHRDLKPSNIRVDRNGRPHVLDFGLAKTADSQHETAMTRTGQFVGSLPWASPEQVEAASAKIDLRTDVYSLGAILFQLLTGALPFDVGSNLRDVLDDILRRDPRRPSSITGSTLPARIDDELDTIILKCLAKDRDRRYQSAGELARDLRNHLAGDPIEARRDSAMYVLRKTLGRYRLQVAAAGAFVVLLAVFGVVMFYLYQRSAGLEREATRTAVTLAELLSDGNIEQARMAGMLGNLHQAEQLLWPELLTRRATIENNSLTLTQPPGSPKALWAAWELYRRIPCLRTIPTDPSIRGIATTADGSGIWTIDVNAEMRKFNMACTVTDSSRMPASGQVRGAQISSDGATVLMMSGPRHIVIRRDQGNRPVIDLTGDYQAVRLSPSGARFALLENGVAVLWNVDSAAELARFGSELTAIALSDDDRRLAARDRSGGLHIWAVDTGAELVNAASPNTAGESAPLWGDLLFSPDGRCLADAWWATRGRLWDLSSNPPIALELSERPGGYRVQTFSRDGRWLAVGDADGLLRVFDSRDGRRVGSISSHRGRIHCLAFSHDGQLLWSVGESELRLWEGHADLGVRVTRVPGEMYHAVNVDPAGRWIVAGGGLGMLQRIERETGRSAQQQIGAAINSIAVAPDGRSLAVATFDDAVELRDADQPNELRATIRHPRLVSSVCFSPDGARLATACEDYIVRIWRTADATLERELPPCSNRVPQITFDPTGQQLGIAVRDGGLLVWNLTTNQTQTWSPPTQGTVRGLRFSDDGKWLVAGGHRIRIWDTETRRCMAAFALHSQEIYCLDIQPRGDLIASGDSGGVIRLWQIGKLQPLATLDGHEGAVMSLRFTSNGEALISASLDGSVREWDLTHYRRHIAGQVATQLNKLEPALRDGPGAGLWREWAGQVMPKE